MTTRSDYLAHGLSCADGEVVRRVAESTLLRRHHCAICESIAVRISIGENEEGQIVRMVWDCSRCGVERIDFAGRPPTYQWAMVLAQTRKAFASGLHDEGVA